MGIKYDEEKKNNDKSTENAKKRIVNNREIEYECYKEKIEYINFEPGYGYEERSTWDRREIYYSREIKFKNEEELLKETIEHEEFYDKRWRRTPNERRKLETERLDITYITIKE